MNARKQNKLKMLKTIAFAMCLFGAVSCDTPHTLWQTKTWFSVFRFQNPDYMEYALVVDSIIDEETGRFVLMLPSTTRRGTNQFFMSATNFQNARSFSPCDIADAETIYYPLHSGYYICFPFNQLVYGRYLSTCKWSELCETSLDTAHVVIPTSEVFADIHVVNGADVGSYIKKKSELLTLDDVVEYANMLIDQYEDCPADWRVNDTMLEYY